MIKRDERPEASRIFMEQLQRSMDRVMRYANLAENDGRPVRFFFSEHAGTRGIRLLTMTRDA